MEFSALLHLNSSFLSRPTFSPDEVGGGGKMVPKLCAECITTFKMMLDDCYLELSLGFSFNWSTLQDSSSHRAFVTVGSTVNIKHLPRQTEST